VNGVEAETQRNRRSIGLLEEQTTRIEKDVATLFRLSDEFRREMDELSEKVTELYELKKQMAVSKSSIFIFIACILIHASCRINKNLLMVYLLNFINSLWKFLII